MDKEEQVQSSDSKEQYKRWADELEASKKWFKKFHAKGEKVVKAFLDDRTAQEEEMPEIVTKLNLFHSNIITLMSMLYGRIPKVEVNRRFADADDDVARVAGEILTRILNTDIEVAGEDMASVFRNGLQDRLLPGLGTARLQYQCTIETEVTPAIIDPETGVELAPTVENEVIKDEWTDTVYTHWKDVLWSPARTHSEVRWKAYRSYLNKTKFSERFSDVKVSDIDFSSKGPMNTKTTENKENLPDEKQVEVWEIWDKDNLCVYWWAKSSGSEILDHLDDPLGLEGFWPDPPPLAANVTTTKYLPRSDYLLAQDLYRQIDELETRITWLTRACKAIGVYDKNNEGVKRIFQEGVENDLIPVDNWAMFAEKGGLKGSIDWVPIKDIADVIGILTEKQTQKIQQLFQVTGMNDIMRGGQMSEQRVSATQRRLEANYGSIRIEALQNEFARWVGDLQALKAEIICKHYQPYCIRQQSNIDATADGENQQLVEAAIQLIKAPDQARWKVHVRPETLAIADYAQLKQDRTEYLMAMSQFLQSSAPILEMKPEALPFLMKMMKWGLAGFRGSSEIEGIMDQAITAIEKQPPQDKPDPEAQKAQAQIQKVQMEAQADQQQSQMELAQDREKHQQEMQQKQQEFLLKMEQMQNEFQLKMTELITTMEVKVKEQQMQFVYNTAEREHEKKVSVEQANAEARVNNGGNKE